MDLRIVKTRKLINKSFMHLFNTQGFEKTTIKDITEHAQIGRKTFYLHYLDKYDLLDTIVKGKFDELEQICISKQELGLKEGTVVWFDYFKDNKSFFNQLFNIQCSGKYKHQLQKFIVNELNQYIDEEYLIAKNLDYQLFLNFLASGIIELINNYLKDNNQKENIEDQVVFIIKMFSDQLK